LQLRELRKKWLRKLGSRNVVLSPEILVIMPKQYEMKKVLYNVLFKTVLVKALKFFSPFSFIKPEQKLTK
jgi:hypothetical protein